MLRWISIFGGLLIMMGHHARSEALFYYFRLEDEIPESHLLRLIDKCSAGSLPWQIDSPAGSYARPTPLVVSGLCEIAPESSPQLT